MVELYVTNIEPLTSEIAAVSIVIDSIEVGRLQFKVATPSDGGEIDRILDRIRAKLERFGRELSDATKPQHPLRLGVPPEGDA